MKILTLQIKRGFLEGILDGSKPEEFREITPKTASRYIIYHDIDTDDEDFEIIQYDAIQFLNGYETDRPKVLIEVKEAIVEIQIDEEGNDIVFTEKGVEYVLALMIYKLGAVLSRENI